MDSKTLRQKFLDFYASKGHVIIPSATLIPKEDPTLLFVNSGMYPLVPYLIGEKHPNGVRLADSQKCVRTLDIEEVGDNRHLSMFEMLGSWSLGDYFKEESITWGFEFLTSKEWLGLDPHRLFVTVYKGSQEVKEDSESIAIWKNIFESVGIEASVGEEFNFKNGQEASGEEKYIYRIIKKSGKDNWWGLPYRGPCGPSSEIFYLLDKHPINFEKELFPNYNLAEIDDFVDNQVVEIWNHVFMEYQGEWGEGYEPINLKKLDKPNIDTGMGFERTLAVLNGFETVQQTDVLTPISAVAMKWSRI